MKIRHRGKKAVKNDQIEKEDVSNKNVLLPLLVSIIAILFGFLNYFHVSYMQEKNVMFSHLSTVERELSFRTEMGFYYSFYKQIVQAKDIQEMIVLLLKDNLTEYPNSINALQRFNVYPEFFLGILYRSFVDLTQSLGWQMQTCYVVSRENLPSVQSCDGIGDMTMFYVFNVMVLNGVMLTFLFLIGYHVSGDQMIGGIFVCLQFFYNHRECTRVQWSPPLRESFSYPFIIIQQLFLLKILRKPTDWKISVGFVFSTLVSLLCWQFAQFALLTQSFAIFLAYIVVGNEDSNYTIKKIYLLLIVTDLLNLLMQFGNTLLITGPLRMNLIMALIIISFEPGDFRKRFQKSVLAPLRYIILIVVLILSTFLLKFLLGFMLRIKSDNHIFDILRSKFTNFRSFDSLLYTCAPEFDFYDMSSIDEISYTGLLPVALSSMVVIVLCLLVNWLQSCLPSRLQKYVDGSIATNGSVDISVVYLFAQTVAYAIMALLIMRLKLFFTPQLCIVTALALRQDWPFMKLSVAVPEKLLHFGQSTKLRYWLLCILIALCSFKGFENLKAEWHLKGVFSNWEQEQLMNYVNDYTLKTDSFAGSMATMATVRLVTGRPVTLHPHFEDEDLRNRVHIAYSVYSRRSIEDIWFMLKSQLHVKYYIFENQFCDGSGKPQCSFLEMWDIEDMINRKNVPACLYFRSESLSISPKLSKFFRKKFSSDHGRYTVFEVLDVPQ